MPLQTDFSVITEYLSIKDKIHSGMYAFDEPEMKQEVMDSTEEDDYMKPHHNNSFLGLENETWFFDPSYGNVITSVPATATSPTTTNNSITTTATKGALAGKSFSLGPQGAGCTVIESSNCGRQGEGELSGGESSPNLFDLDKQSLSFYNDDHPSSSSPSSCSSASNDFPKPRIKLEQMEAGFGGSGCDGILAPGRQLSLTLPARSEQSEDMMQTLLAAGDVCEISKKLEIPINPNHWSHMDTQAWVNYILRTNNYDEDCGALFSVEGEVLCQMRMSDFSWRSSQAGLCLYQSLNFWKLVSQMVTPPVKDQPSAPMFSPFLSKTSSNSNSPASDNSDNSMQVPAIGTSSASSTLSGYGSDQDWFVSGGALPAAPLYPVPPSVSPSPSMTDSTSSADAFVVPVNGGSLTDDEMVMYSPDHRGQQTKRSFSSTATTNTNHRSNTQGRHPHHISGVQHRLGGSGSRLGKQTIHLWQFLRELLDDPENCGTIIKWLDQAKGVFKIEDSSKVAKLWGRRKNRPAMNYDKLSRSVRQYYKKGIIKKTEMSKRLVYQFCHPYL